MIKDFTPNDVIGFVYGENYSAADRKNLEFSIIKDNHLADVFYQAQSVKDVLDSIRLQPSQRCVSNILNFSKSLIL